MSVDNAILFTVITILSLNVGRILAECVTDTPCTCLMSNGEGYDLSKITGPKDEFIQSGTISSRMFYFHPCHDKVFTSNNNTANITGCSLSTGVSLCLYNEAINRAANFGIVKESKWVFKSKDVPQLIIKHVFNASSQSTVTIHLVCNPDTDSPTVFTDYNTGSDAFTYNLQLTSPHACKKPMHVGGLSTGSVLVIIFFVFSGIYFAGGALALKLLRGATGWEMLPNQKFWFDLPALVRDGIAFTFNGCKVVSYDQI